MPHLCPISPTAHKEKRQDAKVRIKIFAPLRLRVFAFKKWSAKPSEVGLQPTAVLPRFPRSQTNSTVLAEGQIHSTHHRFKYGLQPITKFAVSIS